jgi:hypothetical protein
MRGVTVRSAEIETNSASVKAEEVFVSYPILFEKQIVVKNGSISIRKKDGDGKNASSKEVSILGYNISISYKQILSEKTDFVFKNGDLVSLSSTGGWSWRGKKLEASGDQLLYKNRSLYANQVSVEFKKETEVEPNSGVLNGKTAKTPPLKIETISIEHLSVQTQFASAKLNGVIVEQNGEKAAIYSDRSVITLGDAQTEVGVDKAKVTFDLNQENTNIEVSIESVLGDNQSISELPFRSKKISMTGTLSKVDSGYKLLNGSVNIGAVAFSVSGQVVDGVKQISLILPETDCQSILDSTPPELLDDLSKIKMSGKISASFSLEKSDKSSVNLSLKNRCSVLNIPDSYNTKKFKSVFSKMIYLNGGKTTTRVFGPGSKNWTAFSDISDSVKKAVLFTEDPGFWKHNGFLTAAIASSIQTNMNAEKFVRGGSTVSMQLAKNLWLERKKTLSRKWKEFFLTIYLEQSMSKQEIMELYLNVIEFGPGVYGIRNASNYYFGKQPSQLSTKEGLFLASILPSPKGERFNKANELNDNWNSVLNGYLLAMEKQGTILEVEYEEASNEKLVKTPMIVEDVRETWDQENGVDPDSWN